MDDQSRKTRLENGVRIITRYMPYTRSVSMGVWVNVGARDETVVENGLSHFIEHMIFKGTQRRSAFQIAKEFDAIGGHTNAFTTMETTCYHARVMDTHLQTMVDILADIFLNSVFDQQEVERERPVIMQEIGMVEDTPEDYIHFLSSASFWGDNPLGRSVLGTRENILGFDAEMIRGFFQRCYQPERIIISAAGNLEHAQIVDMVGEAFSSVKPGNGFPQRTVPKGRSVVAVHPRNLEQVHVCMTSPGIPIADPRRYPFSLLNTILGGNMSSRLFQEIRERRGLAYSVYSFIASHTDAGMFGVYAGVDPSNVLLTLDLTLQEIRRLKDQPVDPGELRDAKEYTKGNLMLASESVDNQMVRLAQNEIHFQRYVPLQEVVEAIEAITVEDAQELARNLFHSDTLALTLLGPVEETQAFEKHLTLNPSPEN